LNYDYTFKLSDEHWVITPNCATLVLGYLPTISLYYTQKIPPRQRQGVDRNKGNYPEKLPSSIGKKLPHTDAGELRFRYLSLEYFSR
jgi:hypothetical protein